MQNKILKTRLCKYLAQRALTCQRCASILDYKTVVGYTSPAGQRGIVCADCWRLGLQKVHERTQEIAHAYLISIGWEVDTLVNFEKAPRTAKAPTKLTPAAIRKSIFAGHKRDGSIAKHDRIFPAEAYAKPVELIGTKTADGIDYNYASNAEYSALQVAEYVAEYCRLNHLTVA